MNSVWLEIYIYQPQLIFGHWCFNTTILKIVLNAINLRRCYMLWIPLITFGSRIVYFFLFIFVLLGYYKALYNFVHEGALIIFKKKNTPLFCKHKSVNINSCHALVLRHDNQKHINYFLIKTLDTNVVFNHYELVTKLMCLKHFPELRNLELLYVLPEWLL